MCSCGRPLCQCYQDGLVDANKKDYLNNVQKRIDIDTKISFDNGFTNGYNIGVRDGFKTGVKIGIDVGFKNGYDYGYVDRQNNQQYDPDRRKIEFLENLDYKNFHSSINARTRMIVEGVVKSLEKPYNLYYRA